MLHFLRRMLHRHSVIASILCVVCCALTIKYSLLCTLPLQPISVCDSRSIGEPGHLPHRAGVCPASPAAGDIMT